MSDFRLHFIRDNHTVVRLDPDDLPGMLVTIEKHVCEESGYGFVGAKPSNRCVHIRPRKPWIADVMDLLRQEQEDSSEATLKGERDE